MLFIRNWPFVPYVPVLALCVYMYHNGKLNECMYVAVTTSLLYMRAPLLSKGNQLLILLYSNSDQTQWLTLNATVSTTMPSNLTISGIVGVYADV